MKYFIRTIIFLPTFVIAVFLDFINMNSNYELLHLKVAENTLDFNPTEGKGEQL